MVRGMYPQLLAPGLHRTFVEFLDLKVREKEYDKVFNIENTTNAFFDEVQFFGTGVMPEKTEGESVAYTQLGQGGSKRYIPLSYALALRSSWELIQDDLYGVIKQGPKALAKSAHFTEEMVPWNVFNQGFSGIVSTDGVSLFNNQHPLFGGSNATNVGPGVGNVISATGTYPNRPATDCDLSFTALQLMTNQTNRMIDSLGIPTPMRMKYLILPPELVFIAREILGSPGKPFTGDNEINSLLGEDYSYFICHYLTSASAWFAVTEKENHQLRFVWRQKFDADYDDDFDSRSMKMLSYGRFTAGATHWIGTWGSNGP